MTSASFRSSFSSRIPFYLEWRCCVSPRRAPFSARVVFLICRQHFIAVSLSVSAFKDPEICAPSLLCSSSFQARKGSFYLPEYCFILLVSTAYLRSTSQCSYRNHALHTFCIRCCCSRQGIPVPASSHCCNFAHWSFTPRMHRIKTRLIRHCCDECHHCFSWPCEETSITDR
jgi:hypothetical protein